MDKVIALAGNPNSGKTTLFNELTGANQKVGNWPGVTVEHKEGKLKQDHSVTITDLPGIYSLSSYTQEEVVARNYLLGNKPHAIINIIDGSNLERNLYLTTQLIELGIPMVVAVNMMDVVRKRGDVIDTERMSKMLGVRFIEISALKGEGVDGLVEAALSDSIMAPQVTLEFSSHIESALQDISSRYLSSVPERQRRWYALKLFERDDKVPALIGLTDDQVAQIDKLVTAIEDEVDDDSESLITAGRYENIEHIMDACVKLASVGKATTSDKIDRVVTSRVWGFPIFVVVMFLIYYISISTVGTAATDWANDNLFGDGWYLGDFSGEEFEAYQEAVDEFDAATSATEAFTTAAEEQGLDPESDTFLTQAEATGLTATYDSFDDETGEDEIVLVDAAAYEEAEGVLASYDEEGPDPADYGSGYVAGFPTIVQGWMDSIEVADWLEGLIVDGIVAGICAMLGFLPQMFVLFILLALVEGCGYMSRVAFILDRIFRRFGLSGKSFIPILIGTGCGVPGIMASRTIENQNDRHMTIMTTTFIPCSAKIPVIALISAAVFGGVWWVAPSAYFLGLAAILCSGIILKKTPAFAGEATPFIMELPAYHIPTLGYVARSVWDRCWAFIKKAFTVLLVACILIWFLSNFGVVDGVLGMVEDQEVSLLAALGGALSWLFYPLGWADWQATAATIAGFMAKEEIVGTIGILYASGDASWYQAFQASFLPAAAYSFLAFNLLCMPCFAAVSAIISEMNSGKWSGAAIGYQFLTAWMVALWIFQFGGLATGETTFGFWTIVAIATFIVFIYLLVRPNPYKQHQTADVSAMPAAAEA